MPITADITTNRKENSYYLAVALIEGAMLNVNFSYNRSFCVTVRDFRAYS